MHPLVGGFAKAVSRAKELSQQVTLEAGCYWISILSLSLNEGTYRNVYPHCHAQRKRRKTQTLQLIPVYEVVGWSLSQHEKAKSGCGCGPCGESSHCPARSGFFSKLVPLTDN